jgi:hypothetical protein
MLCALMTLLALRTIHLLLDLPREHSWLPKFLPIPTASLSGNALVGVSPLGLIVGYVEIGQTGVVGRLPSPIQTGSIPSVSFHAYGFACGRNECAKVEVEKRVPINCHQPLVGLCIAVAAFRPASNCTCDSVRLVLCQPPFAHDEFRSRGARRRR